jgi:thioredoxin 1
VFVKVDVDANSDTAEAAAIRAVPTFIAFADGKKVKEFSGASIDMLQGLVDTLKAKA